MLMFEFLIECMLLFCDVGLGRDKGGGNRQKPCSVDRQFLRAQVEPPSQASTFRRHFS